MDEQNELSHLSPGWAATSLGEVADVIRGISFPKEARTNAPQEGLIACLRTTNVQRNVEWDDLWFVPKVYVRRDEQIVEKDDILISTANSLELVGKVARVGSIPYKATIGAFISTIRPSREVDPHFLFLQLTSSQFRATLRGTASTTTNISNISTSSVLNARIALPPLPEQHRIVAKIEQLFSDLDAGVATLEQAKQQLKRYRQSVLKAAVEGKLTAEWRVQHIEEIIKTEDKWKPKELTIPRKRAGRLWGSGHVPELSESEKANLPEGWHWSKVRDLGSDPENTVQVGPMSMQSRDFEDSGVPVLNVGCVHWGRFEERKLDYLPEEKAKNFDRYRIFANDVLFTRSGTVGRSAVARSRQNNWLMTFHLLRVRPDTDICRSDYLQMVFEGAEHVRRQTREASIGTTRAGFNTNLLAMLDVPLPSVAEQDQIISEVERRLSVADQIEKTINTSLKQAERLRQSILKRAFAGKLVPQDATDEPAEKLLERIRATKADLTISIPIKRSAKNKTNVKQARLMK